MKANLSHCVAGLLLAGCSAAMVKDLRSSALPQGAHYVALGSSFAAGAGIGPIKSDTPTRCGRTVNNYATLLARQLGLALTDVTCGGATTAHVLGPWSELPPQIEAITPDTRLVTITIGGNDLGYVSGLMGGSCRGGVPLGSRPCFPNRAPREEDYRKVKASLGEIARQVAVRAPKARLVFVQYVTLVPPAPCEAARLPADDAAISRAIGLRLAEITARVATEASALVLEADELSRDYTPCSAQPWSTGMAPGQDLRQGTSPWHPSAAGHAAIAQALAERLGEDDPL